jgi:hypothetical protein
MTRNAGPDLRPLAIKGCRLVPATAFLYRTPAAAKKSAAVNAKILQSTESLISRENLMFSEPTPL